jgi:excisionase family DNA binding protein
VRVAGRGEQSQRLSEFLTTAEAAELLGIPAAQVRRALAAGRLPGRRLGRQWRTTRSAVLAYTERHYGLRTARSGDAAGRCRPQPAA